MNRLSTDKQVAVISALVEGCSVRSTSRLTGVAKGTILSLLGRVGRACAEYQDTAIRNVPAKRVQIDEIWSFVGCKQKNLTPKIAATNPSAGDAWTFVAIEAQSKLVLSWLVGTRDAGCATELLQDVASRLPENQRIQLTTDGHKMYLSAIEDAFGADVDYAMLQKVYGADPQAESRFTRLTNAFSKKIENHMHSVALFYMHYNFVRIHQTLRVTPAMEAGLTTHVWSLEEIVELMHQGITAVAA